MKYEYVVSVSQLRTSLKHRSREYFLENSLHGVSYFADSSRSKWERITWFILIMVSMGIMIGSIMRVWDRFQKDPVLTELDTNTEDITINFPQVLLCFDWSQLNHSSLDKTTRSLYEKIYNWRWGEAIEFPQNDLKKEKNFHRIFQLLTPDCGASYSHCTYKQISRFIFAINIVVQDIAYFSTMEEESCSESLVKVVTPVGACCKFNASKVLTTADPSWTFSFVSSVYPFGLYLLDKMDIGPQRNDKPLHVIHEPTTIEMNIEITRTTSDLHYLTQRQRQCHYESAALTVNNCELHCQFNVLSARCGCVPWFLAVSEQKECPLSKYSCVNSSYINEIDCNCFLPCDNIAYNCYKILATNETFDVMGRENACRIVIMKWIHAVFRRKIRFGYMDLLVYFGGIAGLFLGYSIVTSIELIYYFTLKVYCGAVVEKSRRKHNIIKVIGPKVPRKLDITPIFYNYVD